MNIIQTVHTLATSSFWQKTAVACITSPSYPYLFVHKILAKAEALNCFSVPKSRLQLSTQDPKSILPLIQQTVLGQASFFWLGNIDDNFTEKNKQVFLGGLEQYNGENRIAFFTEDLGLKNKIKPIILPLEITLDEGLAITEIFSPKIFLHEQKQCFIKELFSQNSQFPLNDFIGILDNLELIQFKKNSDFIKYISPMLPISKELSKLSIAFFKKDVAFFKTWNELSNQYPPIFWLSFWSDQWWRAFHLISFAQDKNFILAKKIGYKLPYAFVTKDWQMYQPDYFKKLINQLYTVDYKIKRGHSFCFFDFLFAKHFIKQTKTQKVF